MGPSKYVFPVVGRMPSGAPLTLYFAESLKEAKERIANYRGPLTGLCVGPGKWVATW